MATGCPLTALMTGLGPGMGGEHRQFLPACGCRAVPREHQPWLSTLAQHWAGVKAGVTSGRGLVPAGVPGAGRAHTHPLPPLPADSMGRAEGATPAQPGDPDDSEPGAISLRPVESISDLHWASGGQKGAEGESGAGGAHASPDPAGSWALISSLPCPQAMAQLPPAACAVPRLTLCPLDPRRSCPPCALSLLPAPAPASALATP